MIYYAATPKFIAVTRYRHEGDNQGIYELIMELTQNHTEAENAAGWTYVAEIGEVYEHELFTIEIIDD